MKSRGSWWPRVRWLWVVAAVSVAGVPAAAGRAVDQPRPVAGKWVFHETDRPGVKGTIRIIRGGRYVTSVQIVVPSDSGDPSYTCTITGRFAIRPTKGFSGGRVWYLGATTDNFGHTTPYKVVEQVGSKSYVAYLRGAFQNATRGYGDIEAGENAGPGDFPPCTPAFVMRKTP